MNTSTEARRLFVLAASCILGSLLVLRLPGAPARPEQGRAPAVDSSALVWSADLSAGGFPSLLWSTAAQANPAFENLGFAGSGLLVAAFLVPESAAPYSPRRVRCILLDARTGRALAERQWTVLMSRVGLLAAAGGRLLARNNQSLALYAGNFQSVARFPMPVHSPAFDQWQISLTPDRELVVVQHYTAAKTDIRWLDTADLSLRRSWTSTTEIFEDDWNVLRFSDELIARRRLAAVEVRGIASPWSAALRAGPRLTDQLAARFIAADALLVTEGNFLSVVRGNGSLLLSQRFDPDDFLAADAARSSDDGRRFAIPITGFDPSGQGQILERLVIYDWPDRRWSCELDIRRMGLKDVSAFALSPDGTSLALAAGHSILLYRLPR